MAVSWGSRAAMARATRREKLLIRSRSPGGTPPIFPTSPRGANGHSREPASAVSVITIESERSPSTRVKPTIVSPRYSRLRANGRLTTAPDSPNFGIETGFYGRLTRLFVQEQPIYVDHAMSAAPPDSDQIAASH